MSPLPPVACRHGGQPGHVVGVEVGDEHEWDARHAQPGQAGFQGAHVRPASTTTALPSSRV